MKSPKPVPIPIFRQTHNPDIRLIKTARGNVEVHRRGAIIGVHGREIGLGVTCDGYRSNVTMNIAGKKYSYRVSRLVAMAFIPNPEGLPEVDHIEGNKLDNRAEKLQWVTSEQNRENAGNGSVSIIATKIKTGEQNRYPSIRAAGRAGFSRGDIFLCLKGIYTQHKGFYWERLNA